ncbi:MAG: DUF1963 domain-containing protein, partial [Oscillospiraceae bacterium]|nr:DUF1963 domain-containing protein [Oscillospiraceae bacterium]
VEEEIAQAMVKSKKEFGRETLDKLALLLKRVDEKCPPKPRLPLKPVRAENISVFDSKLGGVPYLPRTMEYPKVLDGEFAGKPLKLLAQLNFEKLPRLEGFPEKGILQFFAGCDGDDVYGIDFDDYFKQNGFHVIYHENIIEDMSKLISGADMPEFGTDEEYYPFTGEFLLKAGEVQPVPISTSDYRIDSVVAEAYNELFGGDIVGMYDMKGEKGVAQVDRPLYDAIHAVRCQLGTCIGGFPFFMQEDPRGYNDSCAKCDILLFQLDSEMPANGKYEDEIMWGDSGVGNFFISSEDLAKRDFSHVLYTWDCG